MFYRLQRSQKPCCFSALISTSILRPFFFAAITNNCLFQFICVSFHFICVSFHFICVSFHFICVSFHFICVSFSFLPIPVSHPICVPYLGVICVFFQFIYVFYRFICVFFQFIYVFYRFIYVFDRFICVFICVSFAFFNSDQTKMGKEPSNSMKGAVDQSKKTEQSNIQKKQQDSFQYYYQNLT